MSLEAREVPASVNQRLLAFMDRYRGDDGALNCPVLLRLRGPLDLPALRGALDRLVARHEALRTTFAWRGRRLVQRVHEPREAALAQVDLSGLGDAEAAVQRGVEDELATRIDPTGWPVRMTLWRVAGEDHVLCVNMHHFVTDGWSCGLVSRDLHLLFERARGRRPHLPEVGWQYSRFVTWQEELLRSERFARHRDYWRRQLEGARPLGLPLAEETATRRAARETIDLDRATTAALRHLAQSRRTTLFNVMLSLYYTLLHHLTGEADLAVASVFANRPRPELHQTVGCLANMVVLRTRLPPGATFADLIRETHATVLGAFLHQEMPFQMLPLDTIRDGRVDNVVFQMAAAPVYQGTMGGAEVDALLGDGVVNRFELELAVVPKGGGLRTMLFYNRARLDPDWAHRLISRFAAVAAAAAARPDAPLAELASGGAE